MKIFYYTIFCAIFSIALFAQPKEEVRATWITTVFNLDWPPPSAAPSYQKSTMVNLLDLLKDANFNTIMLQVRGRGDLLYPSQIEPWARALTGNLGGNPGYDPLAFVIEEAHKKGIEVHAWWNVYKVYGIGTPPNSNPQHVVLSHPELVKTYDGEWWLDPGLPETKTYLLNLAMELVRNYDIDGLHFDFIRYPNPDFQDQTTYETYGNNVNKSDWRRNNISQFVYAMYDSIQAVKPMLKLGSAPIGIYQDLSSCISGWDSYSNTFQDSRRWLLARKHDYLSPQIYWDINSCPRFDSLALNWVLNANGRHIYPGIAAYRMGSGDGNWSAGEIQAQIDSSRIYGAHGQTFFRTKSFMDNQKNIYQLVKNNQYQYPANIPPMPWKDNIKPNSPENFIITTIDSIDYTLFWSKPSSAADGDTAVYYNVYMDDQLPVDISDIKNLVKFRITGDTSVTINLGSIPEESKYFAVTAYDKGYNESLPAEEGIIITSVDDEIIADGYQLEQNYPNPFNPTTKIGYRIGEPGFVTLIVYDVLGKEVAALVNERKPAGYYEVDFEAANLSSGFYFYQLKSGRFSAIQKMLLLK